MRREWVCQGKLNSFFFVWTTIEEPLFKKKQPGFDLGCSSYSNISNSAIIYWTPDTCLNSANCCILEIKPVLLQTQFGKKWKTKCVIHDRTKQKRKLFYTWRNRFGAKYCTRSFFILFYFWSTILLNPELPIPVALPLITACPVVGIALLVAVTVCSWGCIIHNSSEKKIGWYHTIGKQKQPIGAPCQQQCLACWDLTFSRPPSVPHRVEGSTALETRFSLSVLVLLKRSELSSASGWTLLNPIAWLVAPGLFPWLPLLLPLTFSFHFPPCWPVAHIAPPPCQLASPASEGKSLLLQLSFHQIQCQSLCRCWLLYPAPFSLGLPLAFLTQPTSLQPCSMCGLVLWCWISTSLRACPSCQAPAFITTIPSLCQVCATTACCPPLIVCDIRVSQRCTKREMVSKAKLRSDPNVVQMKGRTNQSDGIVSWNFSSYECSAVGYLFHWSIIPLPACWCGMQNCDINCSVCHHCPAMN